MAKCGQCGARLTPIADGFRRLGILAVGIIAVVGALQLAGISVVSQIDYMMLAQGGQVRRDMAGQINRAIRAEDVAAIGTLVEEMVDRFGPAGPHRFIYATDVLDDVVDRNGVSPVRLAMRSENPEVVAVFAPYYVSTGYADEALMAEYRRHFAALMETAMEQEDYFTAYQAAVALVSFVKPLEADDADLLFMTGAFAAWSGKDDLASGNAAAWLLDYLTWAPADHPYRDQARAMRAELQSRGGAQ